MEAAPSAVNRSSRNVCRAFSASPGETVVLLPVLVLVDAVPVDIVVAAAADAAATPGVVVVLDVVVVLVTGEPAGKLVLLPEDVVVVLDAPSDCPKAWNTASMKDLKLVAAFAVPCEPWLPSLSPSLSCEAVLVTALVALVAVVVLVLLAPLAPVKP